MKGGGFSGSAGAVGEAKKGGLDMEVEVGKVFGFLEVIKLNNSHVRGKSWLCKCVCGNERVFYTSHLVGGSDGKVRKSCGCKKMLRGGLVSKNIRLYKTWYGLNERCYDERHVSFERYGAKGVTVCETWRNDYESFYNWAMENGYEKHLTIDRIDSKKGYSPENCRWATYLTQMQNRGEHKDNTSGAKGVRGTVSGRFNAYITRDFKNYNLGNYDTFEEAVKVRVAAEVHYRNHGTLDDYKPRWEKRSTSGIKI